MNSKTDWYENRDSLREGMVFRTNDGHVVMLDRPVAGDATKWFVAGWSSYCQDFLFEDETLEPGDLAEPLGGFLISQLNHTP